MHGLRGKRGIWAVLAVAATVAGCGASGPSDAQRTKLTNQFVTQLSAIQATAPDLVACLSQQARTLPISHLNELARAGPSPSGPAKQLAVQLELRCLSQGKGIQGARALIVLGMKRAIAQRSLPPAFTSCLEEKTNQAPPSQISQLLSAYASEGSAALQAKARGFGVGLGRQCLADPRLTSALRAVFLASFKRGLESSAVSAPMRRCLLSKASRAPASALRQMALNPSGARALGATIGKRAARECVAELGTPRS